MYLLDRAKYFLSVFFILCCSHLALFVNETKSEEINDPMEIANPILTTKGINENPYEIKASKGIKKGDDLELFEIEGKLKTKNVPKLSPITKMGVLQFYPHSISSHKDNFSNLKLQMQYSSLKRDVKAFYLLITELIDLLSKPKDPNYSMDCNLCKFSIKQAAFE